LLGVLLRGSRDSRSSHLRTHYRFLKIKESFRDSPEMLSHFDVIQIKRLVKSKFPVLHDRVLSKSSDAHMYLHSRIPGMCVQ